MKDREAMLDVLEQLTAEVRLLHLGQTVQRSAYLVLARHLAAQGYARLDVLVADLQAMGQTQTEPGWQGAHSELANLLELLSKQPSMRQK